MQTTEPAVSVRDPAQPDLPTSPFWERRGAGLLVMLIAVVVFSPTLLFGRVAFDDQWLWSDDSPLRAPTQETWRYVFFELDARARHDIGTEYLPVRDVVVAVDMAIWGDNEHGPHGTQLALYGLTVLALGGLLVRLGLSRQLAWMSTLLWSIHPLQTESVAWISERKGILAALFVIACGHAWVRYRRGGRWWWVLIGGIAGIAGVWSKAPAMFGPAVFFVWDLLLLPSMRRRWIALAVIGGATALAAVPVVLVARDAGVVESQFEVAPDGRLAGAVGAQGHYLASLVLAKSPSISYPIQNVGASAIDLVLGTLCALGSIALAVWRWRHGRAWRLAVLAWAWIWFLPISHLITPIHIAVADRYVYLWSLSGCIGVAWLVQRTRGSLRLAIGGALICVLGIATLRAEGAWTSSVELFANGFRENPSDPRVCENFAGELFALERREEALIVLDQGLAANPTHPYLLASKARFLTVMKLEVAALEAAAQAAASGHASTMWLYATMLEKAGREAEALPFAQRAARRRPEKPNYAWTEIALLLKLGQLAEAESQARALLRRDYGPASHMVLAGVLRRTASYAESDLHFVIAVQLGASRVVTVKASSSKELE